MAFGDLFQTKNWKNEKHVPAIDCPDSVTSGEPFDVTVSLGKQIAHPNTTEHHIRWIRLYFKPEGEQFAYEIGSFEFSAHGESAKGADQGPVHTHHGVTATMSTTAAGTLLATAYCNIHGLWESSRDVGLD